MYQSNILPMVPTSQMGTGFCPDCPTSVQAPFYWLRKAEEEVPSSWAPGIAREIQKNPLTSSFGLASSGQVVIWGGHQQVENLFLPLSDSDFQGQ